MLAAVASRLIDILLQQVKLRNYMQHSVFKIPNIDGVPILNPEHISIFTGPIHPQSKECVLRIFTKHSENPSVDVMLIFPCKVQCSGYF